MRSLCSHSVACKASLFQSAFRCSNLHVDDLKRSLAMVGGFTVLLCSVVRLVRKAIHLLYELVRSMELSESTAGSNKVRAARAFRRKHLSLGSLRPKVQ